MTADADAADAADGFAEQDVLVAAVQVRFAGPNVGDRLGGRDIGFYGEYAYQLAKLDDGTESDSHKYLIGAEYKIADGMSLTITVGDESGDNGSASGTFVLGGLSWSF